MKTEKQQQPVETVLERPDLLIGPQTGNIGLAKGREMLYVKIKNCRAPGFHKVGNQVPVIDAVPYTGPIDDEMMANILMFGG